MEFTKMHGTGNDYVYVDAWTQELANPAEAAVAVSHRHFGIGADGLILVRRPTAPGFAGRMEMYNADGSRGKMCGNGLRCVAKFLFDRGRTSGVEFDLETDAGPRHALVFPGPDEKAERVRLSMGAPILRPSGIPCAFPGERAVDVPLEVGGRVWHGTAVGMGNPHFVIFVDDVDSFPVEAVGRSIETHPLFPERVNVEFVQVIGKDHLRQRTWERGSGETWACGTGASAVSVAAQLTGRAGASVEIDLLGGRLSLSWDGAEGPVLMTGDAVEVFSGRWPDSVK
jgi:diaminopimelate epimerase